MKTARAQEAPETLAQDTTGEIDVNPESIVERIDAWLDGAIRLLPNAITAIIVIALFFLLGWLARNAFVKWANARGRDNLVPASEFWRNIHTARWCQVGTVRDLYEHVVVHADIVTTSRKPR